MMKWLKKRKKAKDDAKAERRAFLSTLKYGANLDEQWREHKRLEHERREAYERLIETEPYKEHDRLKEEEHEIEHAVLDAIRRHHGLPISEHRWNDGTIVVYDSIITSVCDESPIGWCASYTPEGASLGGFKSCLFCKKEI